MASKDRKTRYREVAGILLLLFFLNVKRVRAENEEATNREDVLKQSEWVIMDRLVQAYGSTDWSAVTEFVVSNPGYEGNPNIMFIPLSLGNAYMNRYEWRDDISDFERALAHLEHVANNHWLWGRRWLAAPVVSYLDISLARLRSLPIPAADAARVEVAWQKALAITEEEADLRLTPDYPYRPLDSSTTGDSKAEEDAWEAGLLAAAANFLPDSPHAVAWDEKARELAYDAITRPSDPPDFEGLKTSTVTEAFELANHGFYPNPTYIAATIELLSQAALSYHLSGKQAPAEFQHNVSALYEIYKGYVGYDLKWLFPSDPSGDASLFPFAFDPEMEGREVQHRFEEASLWRSVEPVAVMQLGEPLWAAVLNSKVVMFYLMGSYAWHWPKTSIRQRVES
jgi:hypothetical protein